MKQMEKVDATLGTTTILLFAGLLLVVVIQILSRYFPYDFTWTEELSRYLFVYSIVTAAPLALRKQEFIRIDMLILALPKSIQRIYETVISVLIILFSAVLFVFGIQFTGLGLDFYAPTLGIPMAYAYAAVPILGLLLIVYGVVTIIERLQGAYDEKGEES
ncbi:TRAP-type C4-dicarboxylate transport system, small permease component [Geomicrobium sp. JCM 19037]|uniref:TRAP transporter small permease n=1 Tax=Geomicrobium sp. JCM 19037 TaxID=1460634 RepID=UPI00045F4193|nr:TRAP transporter small permease [Geomicrobium sp. JCM 19037]GAK03932.1 TRAP-type C4-dicarboxylate transport system, small permease component [Geomicrobium sp. JCM 19037]